MGIAIVTGSGGLIGSESVRFVAEEGLDVIGLENDVRARFFGAEASTAPTSERLVDEVECFRWERLDIRDAQSVGDYRRADGASRPEGAGSSRSEGAGSSRSEGAGWRAGGPAVRIRS